MFGFWTRRKKTNEKAAIKPKRQGQRPSQMFEMLENRTLLSAVVSQTLHSDLVYASTVTTADSSTIEGYTPAQIRKAYGFDNLSFDSGSVTANGQGQTIAIVDAYNDPNIASDLGVFDSEFGLAAPSSLKVVNQTGGSTLPTTDAGWAGEISLDVEWAHAIAPAANILLVEASSSDTADLMAAVNYARDASGVSVVSMSWGGSEFFSWNGSSESDSQLTYDSDFTTPSGHEGVTFISAAGDSGSQSGVEWPASSPNVLSVGGTTLSISDSSGTYAGETGWSGTSSGYSQVETEPTYQDVAQSSGARSVSDVAYDADPNTGFAIYDSVSDSGTVGWQEVGGTSAGAPQWAALVAISDQGRALSGLDSLDGASQTLDTLYSVYSAPDTTGYSTYSSDFNDVLTGGGDPYRFRWGGRGSSAGSAAAGYDLVTGLGSPNAPAIVDLLEGTAASSSGGSTSSGGSGSGSTAPSDLPVSPLSGTITSTLPTSTIGGDAGSINLKLTNISGVVFSGPVMVTLYASTSPALSSDATSIITISLPKVQEKIGKSATVKLKFDYPTDLSGSYYIIASITATATDTSAATAVTSKAVTIAEPAVDLAVAFASDKSVSVDPGHTETATLTITNLGNVTAAGTLDLALYASADGVLDGESLQLNSISGKKIKIGANKKITIKVKFTAPDNAIGGSYDLITAIDSTTTPSDGNSTNDTATETTTT